MTDKGKRIFIDMDGVLVDYDQRVIDAHGHGAFWFFNPMPGAVDAFMWLAERFDVHIASTAPWSNPHAWGDKRRWVAQHLGHAAHKRLTLTHHKGLLCGDYLIDDRLANGVEDFEGLHIHFGSDAFPDWDSVVDFFREDNDD